MKRGLLPSQPLPSDLQRLPLDQPKRGEMQKTHQPRPQTPVCVRTASSGSKACGAFSRQETKMLFSPRRDCFGPPQAVGPVCLPLESFIFVYNPSFRSFFRNWWCSEWHVRGISGLNRGGKAGEEEGDTDVASQQPQWCPVSSSLYPLLHCPCPAPRPWKKFVLNQVL